MLLATAGARFAVDDGSVVSTPVDADSADPESVPRWDVLLPKLVTLAILAGSAMRIFAFARNPSLWIDEAMLALNILGRSPAELLEPLDWNQGAPVGYLMLSKACVAVLGGSEWALRFPSLVAGLLLLAMFVPLAYRILPLGAARLAAVLVAISPFLVGYSAEFKQYELDAAFAVGLLAIGLPVWRGEASRGRLVVLALVGSAAVWCSHPATFVLGGVGLACLADAATRGDRRALLLRAAVVGAWLVSFAACYFFVLRKLGVNDYLLSYWDGKFLPLRPTPGTLAWILHHFFEFFEKPGGMTSLAISASGLAGVMYLIGAVSLARSDWRLLVALVTPIFLAMLASAVKKYPFAGRLLLFAVPAAMVLVAYGTTTVAVAVGQSVSGGGYLILGTVLLAPAMHTYWLTKHAVHEEAAREVIQHVRANWQPGDRLYVFWGGVPAFHYYTASEPFPASAVVLGPERRDKSPRHVQTDLDGFRGEKRVWVLIIHRHPQEESAIRSYLDALGSCEDSLVLADAVAIRYNLGQSVPLVSRGSSGNPTYSSQASPVRSR